MKFRPNRVRELIQRELGTIISRELTFAAKLVTVHSVDLTPDFKNCHVYFSAIGTDDERTQALHKLVEHRTHLQHELAQRVILKFTPTLHFHLDTSIERGVRVTEILRQIDENLPPAEENETGGEPNPEAASEIDADEELPTFESETPGRAFGNFAVPAAAPTERPRRRRTRE